MQAVVLLFQILIVPVPTDTIHAADSLTATENKQSQLYDFMRESGKQFYDLFLVPGDNLYEGKSIDHWENIWQFGFLLAMILLFAILRAGFGNRMNQFFSAVLITRQLRQLMREESFLFHPFSILLLFNCSVVYALIIYKTIVHFNWYEPGGTGFVFYLVLLGAILVIFLTKIITLRTVEFLTDTDLGQRENRYTWILFHQFGGLILLPVAAVMLFGKSFWVMPGIILALTMFFIFLIFRVGKGFLIANGNKVYFLHLILYLCALEIVPLIVMIKVLITQINGLNE